jgi:hypothetical protein
VNLYRMEQLVLTKLGLPGASDPDTTTLDTELQRAYQRVIPNRVSGAAVRGPVFLRLVQGQDTYDLQSVSLYASAAAAIAGTPALPTDSVRAVRRPIFVGNRKQYYYTNPERFWDEFDITDVAQSDPPSAVLVQGRQIVFRPLPGPVSATTPVAIECLQYRSPMTADGITDDDEAMAVVFGAVFALAAQIGLDEIATKHGELFESAIAQMVLKYDVHDEGDGVPQVLPGF